MGTNTMGPPLRRPVCSQGALALKSTRWHEAPGGFRFRKIMGCHRRGSKYRYTRSMPLNMAEFRRLSPGIRPLKSRPRFYFFGNKKQAPKSSCTCAITIQGLARCGSSLGDDWPFFGGGWEQATHQNGERDERERQPSGRVVLVWRPTSKYCQLQGAADVSVVYRPRRIFYQLAQAYPPRNRL